MEEADELKNADKRPPGVAMQVTHILLEIQYFLLKIEGTLLGMEMLPETGIAQCRE